MSWRGFSRYRRRPALFWEKEWSTIDSGRYQEHIMPLLQREIYESWVAGHHDVVFMQDNAPTHSSMSTRDFMAVQGIPYITWPPNGQDLNPIETVWCWMNNYIQRHFGEVEKVSLADLKPQVSERRGTRFQKAIYSIY